MYEQNENSWEARDQQRPPVRPRVNLLATASLICAVLGIVSACCLYGAFIFGGLAIILGLLSRGARKRAVPPARNAIIIGIAAVCVSAAITAGSFLSAIRQYGSFNNFIDAYINTIEQYLGTDLDPPEGWSDPGTDLPQNGTDTPVLPDNRL